MRFAIVAALTGAVACGADMTAPAGSGDVSVDVTLAKLAPAASQVVSGLAFELETAEGRIDVSLIESFLVEVDAVEIHTPGSGWTGVTLGAAVPLNLKALPSEGMGDPIELGVVEGLEAGECRVRLFLSGAAIEFNEDIEVGTSLFEEFTEYVTELKFPSGDQTGLKAEGTCNVPDGGGEVSLLFDEGATLGTITATGNGRIVVSPVIHVHTGDGGSP